ncbi:MAG: hypothetical protein EOO45_12840 [Flavobacterium sp.]|nr:MAG: hypothetical protein EOO45_12840 [Flavobacterium sp.]
MTLSKSTSGLVLNRKVLMQELLKLEDAGHKVKITEVNPKHFNLASYYQGKAIKCSVYFNNDGCVTLHNIVGDMHEDVFPRLIATSLLTDAKTINASIPHFDSSLFEAMELHLPSLFEGTTFQRLSSDKYKITSSYGDAINLTYYPTTGTLLLSGKKCLAYCELVTFLSGRMKVGTFLQGFRDILEVQTTEAEYMAEIRARIGNLAHYMEKEWVEDLCGMLVVEKINLNLPTYTQFAFSSLRCLEGFCKRLAKELSIVITDRNGQGMNDYFKVDGNVAKFRDPASMSGREMTINQSESLGSALSFLYHERNPKFHASQLAIATVNIASQQEAIDLNKQAVHIMKQAYEKWMN